MVRQEVVRTGIVDHPVIRSQLIYYQDILRTKTFLSPDVKRTQAGLSDPKACHSQVSDLSISLRSNGSGQVVARM
jgi:hypothetical protein